MKRFDEIFNRTVSQHSPTPEDMEAVIRMAAQEVKKKTQTRNIQTIYMLVYHKSAKILQKKYNISQAVAEKWLSKYFKKEYKQ